MHDMAITVHVLFISFLGSAMEVGSSFTKVPLMLTSSKLNIEAISSRRMRSCDPQRYNQHQAQGIVFMVECVNKQYCLK